MDLGQFFDAARVPEEYAVLVLNQDICFSHFELVYTRARYKLCADGGYDRLLRWVEAGGRPRGEFEPDVVIGDMDSVEGAAGPEGPRRVKVVEQDRADLQKCLEYLHEHCGSVAVFVVGALGGRFDHELMSLSVLYQYGERQIVYANEKSLVTLLSGTTQIAFDPRYLGAQCGYAPLQGGAVVSTAGFEWDVEEGTGRLCTPVTDCGLEAMGLGSFISTSNRVASDRLTVTTTAPLVFAIEYRPWTGGPPVGEGR